MQLASANQFAVARFIAWQQETMLHVALANAQMCEAENGDPAQAVNADLIAGEAWRLRVRNTITGQPTNPAEVTACTDATIRWCAERLGYVQPGAVPASAVKVA